MKVYIVEYDFLVVTVQLTKRPVEHKIEHFTNPQDFIERVKKLHSTNPDSYDLVGERMYSNIKTYAGSVPELPLEKVLDPFGVGA